MAGILLFAILATIVISLTYIYAAGLSGFFTAFEEHQTISMKNEEYLALSYAFNSTTGLGNLTVTDAWAHPSRIVEILKVSPSGGVSVIPEDVVIYPGQSYTFVNLLQKPYTYAVVTSYGNMWWSSFDMENPALGRYSLTMVANPPQGGTTSPPPGTYYYAYGTEVTISAAANPGWAFAGWTGTGNYSYSGTNQTATIYIWDDMVETANFLAQPQPVTFAAKGLGSDAQGVVLTVTYTTSRYAQGGSHSYSYQFTASQLPVTLEIPTGTQVSYSWSSPVPSSTSGKRYVWVSTSGLDNAQSGTFTVPAGGGQVVATYGTQYLLTMQVSPSYAGTTNPAPGSYWENAGTQVQISASANSGYQFYEWVGSGSGSYSGSANPATVTMNGPITETAYFNIGVTLSASGGGSASASWSGGSASVSGPGSTTFYVAPGTAVQFTATPDSGVTFTGWTGSGTGSYSGSANPVSVTADYPITEQANFAVAITFSVSGMGSDASGTVLTVDGTGYSYSNLPITFVWPYGSQHSFSWSSPVSSSTPGKRYVWQSTSGLSTAQSGTITATQPGSVTATYGIQYYLTMQVSPSGAGSVSPGSGWYNAGSSVQISATPNSGYQFYGWVGSGSGSYSGGANPATITMNGPITETAYFQIVITFSASGLGSDAQGTVLTVNGQSYGYSSLPVSITVPYGSTVSYSWTSPVPGAAGVQYTWISTSGLASGQSGSFTATQPGSVTATYQKQVEVTVQYISGSAPGEVTIYNPYVGTITSGSITFWVPAGSTVSMQAYQGQDSAGYPTLFQWYYDSNTGSTITSASYSLTPSSPDTIYVDYDYTGYVLVQAVTYLSDTVIQTIVSAYEPANMYYYWSPPSSISAYGESLSYVSGPNSIWVQQDQWNTATDIYQEPAAWSGLSLSVVPSGNVYVAQTSGYLIDPATGAGIGGQAIQIHYIEWFVDGTGGRGPYDKATTNSQGYFFNQQGMGPYLTTVQAQIWWSNPPSYYYNPGTVTLSVSGYWP